MTRCDLIAALLPRVADGDAGATDVTRVERHVRDCTSCRILLARERRLSEAIGTIRDVEVDALFTASVMNGLAIRFPRRKRDRGGLKLAVLGGLIVLGSAIANTPQRGWATAIHATTPPMLPADIADPAASGLVSFTQLVLMTLRTAAEAPLVAAALGATPYVLAIAALALFAGALFGSTLLAVLVVKLRPATGTAGTRPL